MNSKDIGNIGEAKTLCKFVEYNIPVYIPFGDNERADLIAEFNGKLNRIQVKTSVKAEDGKMIFDLTSSTEHRANGEKHKYTPNEIDYFVCYNIARDKLFIIPVTDILRASIMIRYAPARNGQTKNLHFENEFLLDTFLASLEANQPAE